MTQGVVVGTETIMTLRITLGFLLLWAAVGRASVVLRVRAHNPSAIEAQETVVRQHLPKGIGRENILEAGELEVRYDDVRDQYYVQQTVELAPRESRVFEVEIEDIWLVDIEHLAFLRNRAAELAETLAGQVYEDQARIIHERIERTVDDIMARQEANHIPDVGVNRHISAYQHNLVLLGVVRDDVKTLEELLHTLGSERVLQKVPREMPPSLGTIWKTIFGIITFVAVVSVIFFLIWTRQLRKIREAEALEES